MTSAKPPSGEERGARARAEPGAGPAKPAPPARQGSELVSSLVGILAVTLATVILLTAAAVVAVLVSLAF